MDIRVQLLEKSFLSTFNVLLIFIVCGSLISVTAGGISSRNRFVRNYEALRYSSAALDHMHQRSRRSISDLSPSEVHLDFTALGRDFNLRLVQDTETFGPSTVVVLDGKPQPSDFSHIYHGYLKGEPLSYVHGSIINGIFSGRIDTEHETYYVDKSHFHFTEKQPFHSFIYSSDDVLPLSNDGNAVKDDHTSCGVKNAGIHEWMNKIQNSAKVNHNKKPSRLNSLNGENIMNRYSFASNNKREKRGLNDDKQMCSFLLQSDPVLWDYVKNRTGYTRSNSEVKDEITALFANHVNGIKTVYFNTTFQYGNIGPYKGITFGVHRMQINTSDSCKTNNKNNPFCMPNIDVSNFLNYNSLSDHDLYCLAFVFTYRDFAQGTLGLAWVGSSSRTAGGICEKFKPYTENSNEVYKSLNTGIVTLSNYGSRVPTKVSVLTFAHEVGHGFGSPHDSGSECVPLLNNPNNPLGNFIMYASATSGNQPNNQKFSKCSIGNMTLVIDAVMSQQYGKQNCFETPSQSFCGNGIVEMDEECDCGFDDDCIDHCCIARNSANPSSQQCHRAPDKLCSPSEGPCCAGDDCNFISGATNKSCQAATECTYASFCNGSSAKCPSALAKPDLALCNENTQICKSGECTGSICEKITNWTVCSKDASQNDKNADPGLLCYVSCMNPLTKSCVVTGNQEDLKKSENKQLFDLLNSLNLQTSGILLPAGAPCDNYRGYCDVFRKCRLVNEDGPLARLTNLLFSSQALTTVRDWITVHWWAVLLMGVAFVVGMGLFIKFCAVHTPSSNPNRPPARKLGDLTLARQNGSKSVNSISGSSDTRPIRPSGQGPPPGKRKKSHQTHNPSKAARDSGTARVDSVEMMQPPHYDNQIFEDYRA